ncbi:MAG: YwaF family protein [Clostridia bacterium]|nr:YwaF family protein [Clostridia bacterium]
MNYWILVACIAGVFALYGLVRFVICRNSPAAKYAFDKVLKVLVIVYCVIVFLSVLLPDFITLSQSKEFLGSGTMQGYALVRWFSSVCFVVLPIAVFFKNRTIRNIAIYFGIAITIVQIVYFPQYLESATSTLGRGLNSISIMPEGVKEFLINPTFRMVIFAITVVMQISIPIILVFQEKHFFKVTSLKEWGKFLLTLPCLIFAALPIYVPQYLFGHSEVMFEAFSLPHILWLVAVFVLLFVLYFVFRKKSAETQRILLLVLSLCLVFQYFQMFGAISISLKRLPLQLCNLGAFFILFSLISMNKKLFNFTVIINVVGVIFALAMPDLDGEGFFYLYNMHFILEHTNVLIIPVLALMFGLFPRLNWKALIHALVGFTIYFLVVWALGTTFNAIATATGNSFYSANYLFMFDGEVAADLLPFTKALFDIKYVVGSATFYPVIQVLVYAVFVVVCLILFLAIRLIYFIKDKAMRKKVKTA